MSLYLWRVLLLTDIKRLQALINLRKLPGDVDWCEVYAFWLGHSGSREHTAGAAAEQEEQAARAGRKLEAQRARQKETSRLYREKYHHPYQSRASTGNSRAAKKGVSGRVTMEEMQALMESNGGVCVRCGAKEHLCFDHILPFYRGGDHVKENLQILCKKCNLEKGVA